MYKDAKLTIYSANECRMDIQSQQYFKSFIYQWIYSYIYIYIDQL